jgi:hypothetical protein
MEKELRAKFEGQLTDKALKNLWSFARKRLVESRAHSSDTPEETNQKAWDAVMDAVCDVFSGNRTWNEEKEPNVLGFLAKAIRSEIYAGNQRGDNSRTEELPEEDLGKADKIAVLPTFQDDLEADDFFLELLEQVSGDEECERILWLFRDGFAKPQEIADEMKVDIQVVYAAKKRLQRKLASYQPQTKVTK